MLLEFVRGRDNQQIVKMLDDTSGSFAPSNLAAVDRVILDLGEIELDSNDDGTYFEIDAVESTITVKIGAAPDLIAGTFTAFFVLYDSSNPNGIQWEPSFKVKII